MYTMKVFCLHTLLDTLSFSPTGSANIHNVEFYHSGQEGFTAPYDPRYSLVYLDLGVTDTSKPNIVQGCSFHDGFSPAIGVYNSHGVLIDDNIIHHTVGQGKLSISFLYATCI